MMPTPDAHDDQARDVAPDARLCAAEREQQAEASGGHEEAEADQPALAVPARHAWSRCRRQQQADCCGQQQQPGLDRGDAADLLQENRDHKERSLQDQPLQILGQQAQISGSGWRTAGPKPAGRGRSSPSPTHSR
jgi:hypothetical protein